MKIVLSRATLFVLFVAGLSSPAWAQKATANHTVNLRRDPSTSSPIMEHLAAGDRLILVDSIKDNGFYHVRTEDDQVGWVFAKYITLSAATPPVASPASTTTTPTEACDPNISAHVYHPHRLIVKQNCIAVSGIIVDATAPLPIREPDGVRHEPDGDTHGWLKVDPEFQNLLNAGNLNDEGGNLVFEIVCRFPVSQTDAKSACAGYTDHVALPPVGSHVRIVGTLVQDTFHGQWIEIHPVSSITAIP
jgi:uncharacterized protein YraI